MSCARIILITSKHVQSVDAKLAVYKKYKEEIDAYHPIQILLHHEYEEFDEVAKLSAINRLSSYVCFIESVRNYFEKDFVDECLKGTITQDTITKSIQQSKEETVGSLKIERYFWGLYIYIPYLYIYAKLLTYYNLNLRYTLLRYNLCNNNFFFSNLKICGCAFQRLEKISIPENQDNHC